MPVKLILRDKEYEVRAGMTLLDALKKSNIVPESVIATRDGEMIIDDEILKDGDVIKLIAVISGGAHGTRNTQQTPRVSCSVRSSHEVP
ncbi:MAG: MoaD/ThiS family protein [Chloroflexi bacterium]|nr:MoaD/ThiS family protein [Chloroflexota bacterium]